MTVQRLVGEALARDELPEDWTMGYSFPAADQEVTVSAPTPKRRTFRTIVQVAVAMAGAVPTAWVALTAAGVDVDPKVAALALGIPAAFVVLVSAGQNAWDAAKGKG